MRAYRANLASDERRSSPRPPRETLADRALVAINTIPAIEADRPYPKSDTTTTVRQVLKKGGYFTQELDRRVRHPISR